MSALGQSVEEAQKKRILENRDFFMSHNILLGDYTYDNPDLNLALHTALTNRSKQRTNGIVGGYFLASGAAGILLGLLFKSNSKRNPSVVGGPVESVFGDIMITTGAITAGCSITFFVTSGNRRRDLERSMNISRHNRNQ